MSGAQRVVSQAKMLCAIRMYAITEWSGSKRNGMVHSVSIYENRNFSVRATEHTRTVFVSLPAHLVLFCTNCLPEKWHSILTDSTLRVGLLIVLVFVVTKVHAATCHYQQTTPY